MRVLLQRLRPIERNLPLLPLQLRSHSRCRLQILELLLQQLQAVLEPMGPRKNRRVRAGLRSLQHLQRGERPLRLLLQGLQARERSLPL